MRFNLLIIVLLFAVLLVGRVYATTDTTGGITTHYSGFQGDEWAYPITPSGSGQISTLGLNMYTGGTLAVALYSDTPGSPSVLLGNSISTAVGTGWQDIAIPQSPSVSLGKYYWISFQTINGAPEIYYGVPNPLATQCVSPQVYGSWQNPFNTISPNCGADSNSANMRMTYSGGTTTITTTSTTTSTTSSLATTIPYISVDSASVPSGTGYETQGQSFLYSITFNSFVQNAIAYLTYNNIVVASADAGAITHGSQTISLGYHVPLLPTNNVPATFNSYATVNTIDAGYVNIGNFNTIKQTELWDYIPSSSTRWSNTIFGQNETVNIILSDSQGLGLATYAGTLQSGSRNSIQEYQSSPYNFYGNFTSFIPSYYGYPNPTIVNSITIGGNAIIQLIYGASSVFRNKTFSFVSTNESLGTCGVPPFTSNALGWSFYTLPNQVLYTSNVNLQGYFQIVKNTWTSPVIQGTSAGIGPATNTFATCLYPGWANSPYNGFGVSGAFTYYAGNYPNAGYYLASQPVQAGITPIKLYFTNYTDPILYSIAVQNTSTSAYISSFVQILQYLPNTNSSVLVNEVQTPSGGTAQTYLNFATKYRLAVYSQSGKLLTLTPYYTTQTCASQPCLLVIYLSNPNVTTLGTLLGNLQYSCVRTDNNVTNVLYNTTIACTYSSNNGASYNTTLSITSGFMQTATCSKNINSQSGSLSCTVGNTNNTQYNWIFSTTIAGQKITIIQGIFGLQGYRFGLIGVFIALILVIGGGLLFITKNPIIAVVMGDIAFVGSSILGLLAVPIPVLGALQLVVVITLFVMMR